LSKAVLYDNHNRPLNYVRLAVTDRCNLRCTYCMPENVRYVQKKELLTFEEMYRLVHLLSTMGISKVRITGGEPFLRKDISNFINQINKIENIEQIHMTTNGVLLEPHLAHLKSMGIQSINLSLDSVDKQRFFDITRRDEFDSVMDSFHTLIAMGMPLKVNMVVMSGKNEEDIIPMMELSKNHPVAVRFIEEMPFNGSDTEKPSITLNYKQIIERIQNKYPTLIKLKDHANSTALNYKVEGFKGSFGVIPAFSRTFCGTCNRIRLTAQGMLKTCLYDEGVLDLKKIIRSGADDEELKKLLMYAFQQRPVDGFEAEAKRKETAKAFESMSTIGG